jgi:S1-C subfamily serine protease
MNQQTPFRCHWIPTGIACFAASCLFATTASVAPGQEFQSPEWLRQRFGMMTSTRRDNSEMIRLLRPLSKRVEESVVQVLCGSRTVALGTIISVDGYVLTKRSELSGDPVRVRLHDGQVLPGRVASVRRRSDLALVKIDFDSDLVPIAFVERKAEVGSFLISPGRGGRPIGIGVVGVHERRIKHNGRLGVLLNDGDGGRALVELVWPRSGAKAAGVKSGDLIVAINGQQESGKMGVIQTLRGMFPGERVRLTIVREGNEFEVDAPIRDMDVMQESENDSKVNGPRNARLSGFDLVIQHDTVLDPDECGGPILDSAGRAIGLNIARAGRVVTYALPSSLLVSEMISMLEEARSTAR